MLDRLTAEESLVRATEVAIGHNLKSGSWIKRQWRAWQSRIQRRQAVKSNAEMLRSVGIGVKVIHG